MNEPDWLKRAVKEGRVTERGVKIAALQPSLAIVDHPIVGVSEKEFQDQVVNLAHQHGWVCAHFPKRKMKMGETEYWATAGEYDAKGWPDLAIARPGLLFFAELKVGNNTASEDQKGWLALLDGFLWYPDSWEEIVHVLTVKGPAEARLALQEPHRLTDDGNPHCGEDVAA